MVTNKFPPIRPSRGMQFVVAESMVGILLLVVAELVTPSSVVAASEIAEAFFESEVRPLLLQKCAECHSGDEDSGGLRIESRQSLLQGGDSGAAIVPGDVSESLLIQAVRRTGELPMPPDESLTAGEIGVLERWIQLGAPWPETDALVRDRSGIASDHWAFQQIKHPTIPEVSDSPWVKTPVDSFVLARLEQNELAASPAADRRSLIRRATYTLTGLPPTPTDVDQFVANTNPMAFELLVERLLESPQYGEHWARHWLDVARYSDTKGYVYAREERFWVHAWAYRDWVVDALNRDMPYDRFLLLQLAADQVEDRQAGDLAAMGFLTLGRRFLGVKRDIIDDRIDVVCRGTMGLTVACARCHNHKYDPIPTADYYSLYGVFDSSVEKLVAVGDWSDQTVPETDAQESFLKELQNRQATLQAKLEAERKSSSQRARDRVADYLFAQSELEKYPADGFDQVFSKQDLLPAFVRRWERYLRSAKKRNDPVFNLWHQFAAIESESFAVEAPQITTRLVADSSGIHHPWIRKAFVDPPRSFREVCDRYGSIFAEAGKQWTDATASAMKLGKASPDRLEDPDGERIRQVLFGSQAPSQVPDGPIVHIESFVDSASCNELWKLQGEVDRWIISSTIPAPHAVMLQDQELPVEPRVFRRGNPINQGNDVPRQFLALLDGEDRQPFQHGSGRLELAQSIIDPSNPLTARVIVNRIWAHHFGQGLVATPSDFGTRAEPPTHPKLLDWLATDLVANSWSLKHLHRQMVLSATFRQSSAGPSDTQILNRALKVDPDNQSIWRHPTRRLSFEELRDSLLATTGDLDLAVGGKPSQLFQAPYPTRRTLYGLVDRQYLPGTLRMFDFANPDLHTPMRNETTVPQQALFLMNHPLVLERAKSLARLARAEDDPKRRIAAMFGNALQRSPTESELADALALLPTELNDHKMEQDSPSAAWQYGYGRLDESAGQVERFTPLPHFEGSAWQGGPDWPDKRLGWVQLTATGGHPGNDRAHAAVRRWTAPQQTRVQIVSTLQHEPTKGDGIRAFIVSSKDGILVSQLIHHQSKKLSVDSVVVSQGDSIDFLVDIGDELNSDQFLWTATIEPTSETGGATWNSEQDFSHPPIVQLDPWEQLAQVLLCTNEFLFVD